MKFDSTSYVSIQRVYIVKSLQDGNILDRHELAVSERCPAYSRDILSCFLQSLKIVVNWKETFK